MFSDQLAVVLHFPNNYFKLIHFLLENTYITANLNYFEVVLTTAYGSHASKNHSLKTLFFYRGFFGVMKRFWK